MATGRNTTWLVTGASRGLGLELVRQLSASNSNLVIATCRNPASAVQLRTLQDDAHSRSQGNLHIVQLDVIDQQSVRASVAEVDRIVGEKGLDVLYNNAGIPTREEAFAFDPENLMSVFKTNVAAPALVAQVYLPLLERGTRKTIVNVSSALGSIGANRRGGHFAMYSLTKTALNMLTFKQAKTRPDFIVVSLCPGHTKTDIGGAAAVLEVDESVSGQLRVVAGLTPAHSGRFWEYTGKELPW
ncbi:NAD(P)-binding protein [Daedalea quercina L-15889]|uniref:NAD(P)-binding protein n=1 Tax=Daedalea quercina L-15889 TaxID=1314783 RepID=A0A165LKR9_9APHY|nr:NAD(P)-binding protein [Daedalea quercina L-15889]